MVGVLGKPKKGRGDVIWVFDGSNMGSGVVVGMFGEPKKGYGDGVGGFDEPKMAGGVVV